jgi:hypothetical protein
MVAILGLRSKDEIGFHSMIIGVEDQGRTWASPTPDFPTSFWYKARKRTLWQRTADHRAPG